MLDREPQPARPRWPEHQPVGAPRKVLVGERLAEHFVVDAEVVDLEAAFWHAGRSASFEGEDRLAPESLRQPASNRPAPQPFVFERRKFPEIIERTDLAPRIPTELQSKLQPEGASGLGVEMPLDDLAHVRIE